MLRPSRVVAVAIIATFVASIANCGRVAFGLVNAPSYIGRYDRHAGIRYGTGPRQSLDVYVPAGAVKRPVVIFWYGGVWMRGAKEQYRFVGAALANSGYVAILPDYRLYPQVHFPRFIEDGASAVQWARKHAAEFGGDPDALFLMGHSAGAHIAVSLALDARHLQKVGGDSSWIRGWIGLSGPYAFELRYPILRAVFPEPYVAADWQPVSLVNGMSPPALILHGTDDVLVPPYEAVSLDLKLRAAGVHVECHFYDETTHFDVIAAFSLPLRIEAPSLHDVRSFIDRTMAAPAEAGMGGSSIPCPPLLKPRSDDWGTTLVVTN
jgi:acetyl esterase/lipase